MASPEHDVWRERLVQRYANTKLNMVEEVGVKYQIILYLYIFQTLVEITFHRYFMVCTDSEYQISLEDIRKWFNTILVECAERPWRKHGRKWAIVQSKLSLHESMWQKRETPIPSSSLSDD